MGRVIDLLHRTLSKSSICSRACAKIRNQANCVVGYHLGESADGSKNGEFHLIDVLAPSCNTFVDVGANVGNWTEHFLRKKTATGFLFEPSQQCISVLEAKFKDKPITLRNVAVGDYSGFISFVEEENCGEGSSILETHNLKSSRSPLPRV
jgi:hypothetical protein